MTSPLFAYPFKENQYRVIDGDTIAVSLDQGWKAYKETNLRLLGLNTPETRTRRTLEKQAGLLTKQLVINWFEARKDKIFYGTSEQKPKFFGRTVGRIWAGSDSDCLNSYLLELKVAKIYNGGSREAFTDDELHAIISICDKELNCEPNLHQ